MGKKQKLGKEEKVAIVLRCLSGEIGVVEAGRIAGVAHKTIRRWIIQYEIEGGNAFETQKHKRIYSPELKEQAVWEYLSGAGSLLDIAKKYKLRNSRQLSDWIKVYHAQGKFNPTQFWGGERCMKQGRETSQLERIQIVKECIAGGKNYGETAAKYQVSYQQIRNWTLRFEAMGEAGLEDRRGKRKKDQAPRTELEQAQIEIEQLKHKLYLAEMENGLLKKLEEIEGRDVFHK